MRTRLPRTPWQAWRPLAALTVIALLAAFAAPVAAQDLQFVDIGGTPEVKGAPTTEGKSAPAGQPGLLRPFTRSAEVPLGQGFVAEVEPNGTFGEATPLGGTNVVARGSVFPNADVDWYSFTASAGDRVYAAVMTSFSSSGSTDSQLRLFESDGATLIEFDEDDGSLGGLSSSIAGAVLPAGTGTYYLQVKHFSLTGTLRPYELHFRLQSGSGAPTPEVEGNDTPGTANPLPANGWVSGTRDPALATEQDWYSIALNAGDTLFLSLDLDPERDVTTWNGRLGVALFGDAGNQILVVDDGGTVDTIDSEALFMTVKTAGTYYAFVDSATAATGGPSATYTLSVSVHPAADEGVNCTTYTSTDVPQVLGPGAGLASSTITVPPTAARIADIDVSITLDHLLMADVDANLRSPAGNNNALFNDIGSTATGGQTLMDLTLDDEAGVPFVFTVVRPLEVKPELSYRLDWLDGEDPSGVWTLDLRDDLTNTSGGNLTAWSLRICEAPPVPACGPGFQPVTVFTTDFEANDGGFTHSGTFDEWEYGTPATLATTTTSPVADITTCSSGVNCWKTDLDNTYDASSIQDLVSPAIDLTGLSGPVVVSWAQRYQMESSTFDHFDVTLEDSPVPTTAVRLFDWTGATMTAGVGSPTTNIGESAGWSRYTRRADSMANHNTALRFHLDGDSSINFAGAAIDDVTVTACEPVAGVPAMTLSKTVGLTAGVCGVDETLVVPFGTPVTYCYLMTNTGNVTLNYHTVVDDQLGTLLNNFLFPVLPGNGVFFTVDDVVLAGTTTNNATWTAYESVTSSSSTTCSTPALAIPDSTPAGVDDILVMATSGTLTDLDVSLDLTHTWVGDVTVSISNGTTTASFFDRPGYTGSGFGCSGDNADVIANDEGVDPGIEGQCTNAPAVFGDAPGGDPTSTTLFAAFDGQPLAGTWTLHASDSVGGDTGTINEWCLIASYEEGVGGDADSDSVTVTVLPPTAPDIAVSPGSLSSFQAVDTTTDHMLDITNNGDANLDWTITEDAGLIGHYVVAQVPGRQQPILPHRRSTPPEANEITTGDQTLSRSTTSVAGGTTTPVRGEAPDGTTTITHSASQAITALNSVSCNSGGFHADNSYLRSFTLTDFGITGGFGVTQVEVGIEQATGTGGTQPATVNLYTWDPVDPFTFANFVPIGTVNTLVPDQAATIITVPVTGSAPAGSTLVVEFFTPSGQPAVAQLFVGSNAGGQTAPTYIASAACGLPEPTDTAAIGFPNMHLVMNVTGSTGCDVDLTWASVSSAAGTTVPSTTDQVTVTLDSTGLIQGAIYTGGLCIQSNDPDTPLVLVPLTLEVDGMDFSDGFETGDTSRWSVVAP